jgi:hypothetical protein
MKTKFDVSNYCFLNEGGTVAQGEEIFEKELKDNGFLYDKETETVYTTVDRHIDLNEGDRVSLCIGIFIVEWKCYDIDEDVVEYVLKEE